MYESIKSKILNVQSLSKLRKLHPYQKIVFCSGCFDIIQTGHAIFFNQARELGDLLVVGVGRDSIIQKLKGSSRPINPELNRLYLIAAMQDVDYCLLNENDIEGSKIDFLNILKNLKPDTMVLNDDDNSIIEKKELCDSLGINLIILSRKTLPELKASSSTKIIEKINFSWKAPLRIDFAGGWTDIPEIMNNNIGYVTNLAIKPLIELRSQQYNLSGYPKGSGISTSTAVKILDMISSKNYNLDSKEINDIAEDLYILENKELNWMIGRQDQYSIVYGGMNTFEFGNNYAKNILSFNEDIVYSFCNNLVLMHTGVSRNAQSVVKEVYSNYNTSKGNKALSKLSEYGLEFGYALQKEKFDICAELMELNFFSQKELAQSTSDKTLDEFYKYAQSLGAKGKVCGAGGGGAFIFYVKDKENFIKKMIENFPTAFPLKFEPEFSNIKQLNLL